MADIGSGFREGLVDADGFRIRYQDAGEGPPLVHLHGAGGLELTLVLDAPATIRPEGSEPVFGAPEIARRLYAHPERVLSAPAVEPALAARRLALVRRLRGPGRDAALEEGLRGLGIPALVLFGTQDRVIPPAMGRVYKELIPNAHLVFVYDAGHALMVERPEAVAEVVADFLERTDAFVISRTKTAIFP